jgi:hypothetical protein
MTFIVTPDGIITTPQALYDDLQACLVTLHEERRCAAFALTACARQLTAEKAFRSYLLEEFFESEQALQASRDELERCRRPMLFPLR